MTVKLLAEHDLELLDLTGDCTGWSESTLVKLSHCWKSRVTAQLYFCRSYCLTSSYNIVWFLFDYNGIVSGGAMYTVCKAPMWLSKILLSILSKYFFTFKKVDRE